MEVYTGRMSTDSETTAAPAARRWRPLESIERRVLGVLVEKAKTTPEAYPLSVNALRTGCNQKNNRAPLMQLEESQVDDACEQLRKSGALAQVQGSGRVDRYRHLAYEWLGVEKVELAVMAELLLRGSQTVGELRGRAARMEPIKGLGELQPILDSLEQKGLIQYLTPPGRGCIVTHTLYLDREMEKVRREAGTAQFEAEGDDPEPSAPPPRSPAPVAEHRPAAAPSASAPADGRLAAEVATLREELGNLKRELAAARAEFDSTAADLRRDLDELNRQLGN
jgi:uncharacterized protein YceH (UPF0502 family)